LNALTSLRKASEAEFYKSDSQAPSTQFLKPTSNRRPPCGFSGPSAGKTKKLSLLVWYVARHKDVSHKMMKISDALDRLNRQVATQEEFGSGGLVLQPDTVLLNPENNNPLKVFQMPREDIYKLGSADFPDYTPDLQMTGSERSIIEKEGTVCVLGRSGTGKTICISNRISLDRVRYAQTIPDYRQCFIARSKYVCELVQQLQIRAQKDATSVQYKVDNTQFVKLDALIADCSARLPWESKHADGEEEQTRPIFPPDSFVGFNKFKDEFVAHSRKRSKINPQVAWIQIKSFIKGSIEALVRWDKKHPGNAAKATVCEHLSEKEYANGKIIGHRRCALDADQRKLYYEVFEEYQRWCKKNNLWDDLDRMFDLFKHQLDPTEWQMTDRHTILPHQFHNIYVDEVQDFTQVEIALLLMLSGPKSLFLAGDNAQSVEEGVVFRFTEVRRVIYAICNKGENPNGGVMSLVPEKESHLKLNFRSHSGVLNVAKLTLDLTTQAFPNNIDELAPDEGLCRGPRPMLLELASTESLSTIAKNNEGVIMLTPDLNVKAVVELCGMDSENTAKRGAGVRSDDIHGDAASANASKSTAMPLADTSVSVIGIREAKGMEYEDVAIVNFFQCIDRDLQTHFKSLINNPDPASCRSDKYPELAGHLKLLYTAITRCKTRLLFIETEQTIASRMWFRKLIDYSLAEKINLAALGESGLGKMSPDEWRVRGIDWAIKGAEDDDMDEASKWLQKAVGCFKKAQDDELLEKADSHIGVLEKRATFGKKLHEKGGTQNVEKKAAKFVLGCVSAGLREEGVSVCRLLKSRLANYDATFKSLFEWHVIRNLQGGRRRKAIKKQQHQASAL